MNGFILSLNGKGDSKNHIVFEGNSFFEEQGGGIGLIGSVPVTTAIKSLLGNTFEYVNYATGGYSVSDILALPQRVATALANRNENRFHDIVCMYEFVNEPVKQITLGGGLVEVITPMFEYGRLCTGKGFKFIFNTSTPRTDQYAVAGYEVLRQNANNKLDNSTINGYIRNIFNIPTDKDLIFVSNIKGYENMIMVDTGNSSFGQVGNSGDNTKYVDNVHPTTLVSNQIAGMYVDGISVAIAQ